MRPAVQRMVLLLPLAVYAGPPAHSQDAAREPELLRTDSRAPYIHRLTLYDADGKAINPKDPAAPPYSSAATCGKCHPYEAIERGWHFNAFSPGVNGGRPGEPWLLVDEKTGTVLPLSGRGWPGTFSPDVAGLTSWEFALRFGRHLPGGGAFAPPAKELATSTQRWRASGPLEIDCMLCHSAGPQHDPAEWARQIEQQNFRYAATAAMGLAVIRGSAAKLPEDFDPDAPPNPDFPERTPPKVIYDRTRFDADDRTLFDLRREPAAERCYSCHSTRDVGTGTAPTWQHDGDVHLAAGLTCADCHRNDIGHQITRGYPGEAADRLDPGSASLSCRGCHLGGVDSSLGDDRPGRLGAPHPQHRGLPLLHLERLSCTACHAGPWPQQLTITQQTSLAHGLGLPTRERGVEDPPLIYAPVFARDAAGVLTPHRLVWPGYWGHLVGDQVLPLPLDLVSKAVGSIRAPTSAGTLSPAEALVAAGLAKLAGERGVEGEPVLVRDGNLWRRSADGTVSASDHPAAAPILWPIAHDVRPAERALGASGCTDCHAADGVVFFGQVGSRHAAAAPRPMAAFNGYDDSLARVWATTFGARELFKWLMFAVVGLLGFVLAHRGLRAVA